MRVLGEEMKPIVELRPRFTEMVRELWASSEFADFCTGDMPTMDHFYHIVQSEKRAGESFEATQYRLRREIS